MFNPLHECNTELMYLWWEARKQQPHAQVSRKAGEILRERIRIAGEYKYAEHSGSNPQK